MKTEICHECKQPIQKMHKEVLSKHKLTMLQAASKLVIATGVNSFNKRDIINFNPEFGSHSDYANWQKLRYHGLIAQVKKDGVKIRGQWLITRNGWSFLRGEIALPKFVLVKNNHIEVRAEDSINVRDVYRGSEVITTMFEYFDDEGNMVGVRPMQQSPTNLKQMALV